MGRRAEQGRTEQRRAELIEVTAREIARVGLERVTLRDIARAGGWTTGIVSHYFVDKRELMIATFRSRADRARSGSTPPPPARRVAGHRGGRVPLDAERAQLEGVLAFGRRHRRRGAERHPARTAPDVRGRHRGSPPGEQDAGRFGGVTPGAALRSSRSWTASPSRPSRAERWPAEEQLAMVRAHLAQLDLAPSDA